jgi:hypothetical protein
VHEHCKTQFSGGQKMERVEGKNADSINRVGGWIHGWMDEYIIIII